MRIFQWILIVTVMVATAACSTRAAPESILSGAPAQPAATQPVAIPAPEYRLGASVTNSVEAETAALQLMADPSFQWTTPPRTMVADDMTYEEALKGIWGVAPDDEHFATYPRETPVWMVVFFGKWTLKPMGPAGAAPVPYEGCLFMLFTANDGTVLARGDAMCPGKG